MGYIIKGTIAYIERREGNEYAKWTVIFMYSIILRESDVFSLLLLGRYIVKGNKVRFVLKRKMALFSNGCEEGYTIEGKKCMSAYCKGFYRQVFIFFYLQCFRHGWRIEHWTLPISNVGVL